MIAVLAFAAALQAPPSAAPPQTRTIVYDRPQMKTAQPDLTVSSGSFPSGGAIPMQHSGYGKNLAPSLHWTAGPDKTLSYVVIAEDSDAGDARPLLHWLAYDIPADTRELAAKTKNLARVIEPIAFSQSVNDHGGLGWTGPHPPVGDPAHHYHFQVFALDRGKLAPPGASFEDVVSRMSGHVLAKGQVVALYAQRAETPRKPKGEKPPRTASPPAAQP